MALRNLLIPGFAVAAVVFSVTTTYGQFGGGGYGGGGNGRERRREGYDPAEFLKRLDGNKNGMIEPSEVSGPSRMFIDRGAEKAGLDKTKAMPIDKLLPAMQANSEEYRRQRESQGGGNGRNGSSSSSSPSSTSRPTTGFGSPPSSTPTTSSSGFGSPSGRASSIMSLETKFDQSVIDYVNGTLLREQDKNGDGHIDKAEWTAAGTWSKSNPPETSDLNKDGKLSREELCIRISKSQNIPIKGDVPSSSSSPSPTFGSSSSSPSNSSSDSGDKGDKKFRRYAESLLKDHDKNKDGMLQADEWKEMKTEHRGADTNGDGVITQEELTARITAYSSGGASSTPYSPSSSGPSASHSYGSKRGSSDKSASAGPKKSYRFLTPTERLPKGMPDWFIKNDADGDGQIMMAEYAASFTEAIAAEFASYDRDGDGIITPNEALGNEKK